MTADVLRKKLQRLEDRLSKIDRIAAPEMSAFVANEEHRDLAAFYLVLAIEECIDLAEHLVAENDWGTPEDAGGEFEILASQQVIDANLARQMREAVGLPNLLIHEYAEVDWSRVHAALRDLSRVRNFAAAVMRHAGL